VVWNVERGLRNKVALLYLAEDGREEKLTYGELLDRVRRLATGLRRLGVGKGDRVVIYMPLTLEGVLAMLATAYIGAIHSVVYAGLGVSALRERILDAQAKLLIAGDVSFRRGKGVDLRSIAEEAIRDLPLKVVWFQRAYKAELAEGHYDFHELLWGNPPEARAEMVDAEHPLFILYTSGSTGKPKGVVHVHGGYMVGTTYHLRTFFDVKDEDVFWATSDIGWIVGHSYIVYAPLLEGITSVLREGAPDHPDPGALWQAVERYRVNVMFTAPTAIRSFMKWGEGWPGKHRLDSLRLLGTVGEPINPEAWLWYYHVIGKGRCPIVDTWWQTETGGIMITTLPGAHAMKPGHAGKPFFGVVPEILDGEHRPVENPDEGGHLCITRPWPSMLRTVWGDPERFLQQYFSQHPGVYFSGDGAKRDKDGYYMILGRADDVLNVAGHRIGTADVESALVSHPAVAEAAVIGVPDPLKGEAIKAFVVLRLGQTPSEELKEALVQHVRRELGPIATPSEVVFLDKLPKTRSGKILRRLLKAQALGKDPGDLSTLEE